MFFLVKPLEYSLHSPCYLPWKPADLNKKYSRTEIKGNFSKNFTLKRFVRIKEQINGEALCTYSALDMCRFFYTYFIWLWFFLGLQEKEKDPVQTPDYCNQSKTGGSGRPFFERKKKKKIENKQFLFKCVFYYYYLVTGLLVSIPCIVIVPSHLAHSDLSQIRNYEMSSGRESLLQPTKMTFQMTDNKN